MNVHLDSESMAYIAHEKDDHGHLVKKSILTTNTQGQETERDLYIIGGSTLREGLLKDRIIQQKHLDSLDSKLRIVSLYSFDQTLAETARIALAQNISPGDIVIINLNPRRLGFGPETLNKELSLSRLSMLPRKPLYPLIDKLNDDWPLLKKAKPVSLSIMEHRLFVKQWLKGRLPGHTKTAWGHLFSLRLNKVQMNHLIDLKPRHVRRYLRYAYGSRALSQTEKIKIAATVKDLRVTDYKDNNAFGFDLLNTLTNLLVEKGADVVFLDLPRTQLSQEAYGEIWSDYNTKLDDIAKQTGVHRVDLRSLPIPQDDYYDLEHVMQPSRPMLTLGLIEALNDGGWIKK